MTYRDRVSYSRDSSRIIRPPGLTPEDIVPTGLGKTSAALIDCWSRVFPLRRRTLIGRDRDTVDIAILDDVVSLCHAELILGAYGWSLIDRDSTNGTFIDGRRISEPSQLSARHMLTFGDISFVFVERYR